MTFDQVAERVTRQVVRPWFFLVVSVGIAAWLPTLIRWDTGSSDLLIDSLTNPLSLLLLILLQNSQVRSDRANDERQDHLERSVALVLRQLAQHQDDKDGRAELLAAAENLEENSRATRALASADLDDDG